MCNYCSELSGCAWHAVRAGESLVEIALRHGTTPLRLLELNPFIDPAELVEGMRLFVPCRDFARARYGESLARLSARLGVSPDILLERNPALAGGFPLPGQRVRR